MVWILLRSMATKSATVEVGDSWAPLESKQSRITVSPDATSATGGRLASQRSWVWVFGMQCKLMGGRVSLTTRLEGAGFRV